MQRFVITSMLLLLCLIIPNASFALTPDQEHNLAVIRRDQSTISYNDQVFAALMRNLLTTYRDPAWVHVNMLFFPDMSQIAADSFVDLPLGAFSIFGGFQVYLMEWHSDIPGLTAEERDTTIAGMNIPLGVNIYLQEMGTVAAGVRMIIGEAQPLSDSEMEAKAKGEPQSTASLFTGIFKPYIFYEGPLTPYLNFRLDSTYNTAENSISRFGTDVLARYGRISAGPLYDTLQMVEGRQSNLALAVVYALQQSAMPGYGNLLPKVTGRYGRLTMDNKLTGVKETESYWLCEFNQQFVAGLSLRSDSGLGFKIGYTAEEDGILGTIMLMKNYPYETIYGSIGKKTVIHFYLTRSLD